jgi:hypothetical protein
MLRACAHTIYVRGVGRRDLWGDAVENDRGGGERRHSAVAEIREHHRRLYRGFVGWASLYGDADDTDELERR